MIVSDLSFRRRLTTGVVSLLALGIVASLTGCKAGEAKSSGFTTAELMDRDPNLGRAFREGLARPGGNGTLKNRFATLDSTAAFRGKTGTLTNVSALAGYVTASGGERVVFSMLTNGNRSSVAAARDAEERLVTVLARSRHMAQAAPQPIGIPR